MSPTKWIASVSAVFLLCPNVNAFSLPPTLSSGSSLSTSLKRCSDVKSKQSNVDFRRVSQARSTIANKSYVNIKRVGLNSLMNENNDVDDILRSLPKAVFDRRTALTSAAAMVSGSLYAPRSNAEPMTMPQTPSSSSATELENGLLESRVTEDLMSPPLYGMESTDVFYPKYFAGTWEVNSVTAAVEAPCGTQLFGGNSTFLRAQEEIGEKSALKYRARFVPITGADGKTVTIADREFNVREIAKAAMGINSVVDVSMATPNKFSCLLAPTGAGKMLNVDMIALARRQEYVDKSRFDASEVVRQIVSTANDGRTPQPQPMSGRAATLLKELETISLYTVNNPTVSEDGAVVGCSEIKCQQRSATFLLPSQDDPMAYRMWQMSRGRPIDVRFYDVTYTKKS